jgi:hypothetical protein
MPPQDAPTRHYGKDRCQNSEVYPTEVEQPVLRSKSEDGKFIRRRRDPRHKTKDTSLESEVWGLKSGRKVKIDSDLSAAIKKLCRRTVVDTCCCNDQAWCIGIDGSIADYGVLHICTATLARSIITCVKRNGFDNFTGDSFSHFTTPIKTIVADSGG